MELTSKEVMVPASKGSTTEGEEGKWLENEPVGMHSHLNWGDYAHTLYIV